MAKRRNESHLMPKFPTTAPMYAKKIDIRAVEKIEEISTKLEVAKWRIINTIICHALKIKIDNGLDLKKYLKK